jgi:DNA-binding transcriptional ArsR family regulator
MRDARHETRDLFVHLNKCSYICFMIIETQLETRIPTDDLEPLAHVLKAIAHPARLAIVDLLSQHDQLHCTQLMEATGVEQSLLSHHLTTMHDRGILSREKDGKYILYRLSDKRMANIIECIVKRNG